ncbi:MAG: nucleotidyltransferase domain-containing protein [Chloroflexota bacterium]|nr:nucleotidyltransferase domain-containing protein [Chloroflexota bacterium]
MDELLNREQILEILREELPYLRERYGVESVAIYGSFSKGSYTDKSDIDILVKLIRPLGFDFVGLALYLEDVLARKVDLITHDTLERNLDNPRYRHIANDIQGTLAYA